MSILVFGVFAFALFFFHDSVQLVFPQKNYAAFFYAGIAILLYTTVFLAYRGFCSSPFITVNICLWLGVSIFFCALLIYTLFFALPFDATYRSTNGERILIADGVYALCRHPGILWFAGMYGALYTALGSRDLAIAFPLFSLLNLLYAALQDRLVFPRQFSDYDRYRQNTPFLIPTPASIVRCIRTWPRHRAARRHQGDSDEF